MEKRAVLSSNVRKNWSETIDYAVRNKPVFIERTRDELTLINNQTLLAVLNHIPMHVLVEKEEDGSVTMTGKEIEVVENAPTRKECLDRIVDSLVDFSGDFYDDYEYWTSDPARQEQIPFVMKCLLTDRETLKRSLVFRDGKI